MPQCHNCGNQLTGAEPHCPACGAAHGFPAAVLRAVPSPDAAIIAPGFQYFLPLLLPSLVAGLFIGIGMVLLIIPGLYLVVAYLFASYLVIDRRLDFWPAMGLSRRTANPGGSIILFSYSLWPCLIWPALCSWAWACW